MLFFITIKGGDYAIDIPVSSLETLPQEIFDLVIYDTSKPIVVLGGTTKNIIPPDMSTIKALFLTSKKLSENSKKCINNSLPLRLLQGPCAHEYCAKFLEESFKKTFKTYFIFENNMFEKIRKEYDEYYQKKLIIKKPSTNIVGYRCNAANKFYTDFYQKNPDAHRAYALIQQGNNYIIDTAAVNHNPALLFDYMNQHESVNFFTKQENYDIATIWINWLANVNKADNGSTPLCWAVWRNNFAMAELLIANKADVNKADTDGLTPLYQAVYRYYSAMAQLLIANKVDVDKADNYGWTPLYSAVCNNNSAIAQLLIKKNAYYYSNKRGIFFWRFVNFCMIKLLRLKYCLVHLSLS